MNRALRSLLLSAVLIAPAVRAADPPRFGEVLDLVRSNLAGISESQLNAAVVQGLIDQLQPRVFLLTNGTTTAGTPAATPAFVSRTNVFESAFAYLRIDRVTDGLAEAVRAGVAATAATNTLKGLVLDLRFTPGEDFREAGRVADLFVGAAQPLLDWGEGEIAATEKTNALSLPLAVLVNAETRGAAEALAAAIQETRTGLVIGRPTAGQAAVFREWPLSTGQRLRVAVAPVKAGGGGRIVPATGLTPDITITPAAADERKYFDDPYRPLEGSAARTNASRSPRLTEADLVRLHREGIDPASARLRRPDAPPAPQVTDPALVRALDLLKGLAVVESRQP
jgi:carboxyl-terminal processing protease